VCVRWVIAIRSQCFGRPFAAVGADLSCPHIRKHTRNGGGNADLVMWIHIFGNADMCICLC